ncbi:DNA cytosine methyltransferase [Massilia sp. NR 4-1]|uniref:DNA cytosine methyltransferase n=1 Tax=Massilia sp. NR 4-1 TaxID=1678028 RepID=UPI0012374346|nr:DNA cytosine methyltransferase [Massilia sp. NR 4-1]
MIVESGVAGYDTGANFLLHFNRYKQFSNIFETFGVFAIRAGEKGYRLNMVKINKKNQSTKPTFIDVFAGCGGLSLGLMKSGWNGLFAVEHDANAFKTLQHNLIDKKGPYQFSWPDWLPRTPHSAIDILQNYIKNFEVLEDKVDMLVGGPPCQGFSMAGRRDPNDPRNKLVEAYFGLVNMVKPRIVLIENVKGITLDFDEKKEEGEEPGKINYAKKIIKELSENYTVSSKLIDTSQFGVPQKRHRFFIVAVRKDVAKSFHHDPIKLIESERLSFLRSKDIVNVPISAKSAISDLTIERCGKAKSRDSEGFEEIRYEGPLTSYQKLMNSGNVENPSDTRLARHKKEIRARFKKIMKICQDSGRLNVSLSAEVRASFGLKKCAIRVMDPDSPSPTITSMPDDLIHFSEARTLTVRENARIQSFPDWFEFKGKYTSGGERRKREVPRFTQVANAVPPLMAEAIGATLLNYYFSSKLPLQSTKKKSAQMPLASQAKLAVNHASPH